MNPEQTPQNNTEQVATQPVAPPAAAPATAPAPVAPVQQPVQPKKRFPLWAKIVIGFFAAVIVIFTVIALALNAMTQAPQKVSDEFLNDVQASNTSAAYALTSQSFQQATSQDQLDQLIQQDSSTLKGTESVTGRSIQSVNGVSSAAIVYSIPSGGTTHYAKVELQDNNNTWQVVNFQVSSSPLDTTLQ